MLNKTDTIETSGADTAGETLAVSQVFAFDSHALRVIDRDGEPWFCAADIAACLGLENPSMMIQPLDNDEKGLSLTYTLGGAQSLAIVSEAGLYTIALRCRGAMKPGTAAHTFRRWVTHEVLPTIRRSGGYGGQATFDPLIDRVTRLRDLGFRPETIAAMLGVRGQRKTRGPRMALAPGGGTVPADAEAKLESFHRMARAVLSAAGHPEKRLCTLVEWVELAGDTCEAWSGIAGSRSVSTSLGSFLRNYAGTLVEAADGCHYRFEHLGGRRSTLCLRKL